MADSLQAQNRGLTLDLAIINGNIRTMSRAFPSAQAVGISGNRIVLVGSTAQIREFATAQTTMVDARTNLVLPGFNDSHVHFLNGGFQLSNVDLRDARTPTEFTQRIHRYALRLREGEWITGGNWDHQDWPGSPLPRKEMIDQAAGGHPVLISRLDGHMALANSLALRMAGVTRETPDPIGGVIVRDSSTGEPTGILKDSAMDLVSAKIPVPSRAAKLQAARSATQHAASVGVTSIQDMSAGADLSIYQEMHQSGELQTRIYAISPLPQWERLAQTGVRAGFGNPMLRLGGLKGFSDGSLGSSTAYFFDPYLDQPANSGLLTDEMYPAGAMLKRVAGADAAGLQVMIHAIGDRANHEILSLLETVAKTNPQWDRRFRIEHAQHLRAEDIRRFAAGQVVASMQPYHAADDGRWAEKKIGRERARGTYAFRSLLQTGAVLAFGSDWPVAPLDPLQGIAAAVTRRTLDGKHPSGWVPEEKIAVEAAVHAYTVGSAYAEFTNREKGTIAPGMLADLIILDRDIFKIKPVDIEKTKVLVTVVDGRIVYHAPKKK